MPVDSIPGRDNRSDAEYLESRILLSAVISVSPGYQDATQTIQNALNSAGGGGTVNLAPGSYNVSSQLTIPSGVMLEGGGKATLNWTGGGMGNLLYSPWDSVGTKVDGVTLNGAGYKIDPDGSNLTVSNNTFENISFSDSYFGNGLYIPNVESNSSITGNTFTNITGNVGIYIFNPVNVQIDSNTFSNDSEAIKGQWSNAGSNDSISNNTLTGIYRFGIECQGDPVNLTVSGNTLGNWQPRDSHIALSIATGEGNGINITNNVILGTGISNPNTAYTAIEAMGDNLTIADNFASGWGWAQLVGYTDHWVTENNTWGVNTAAWVTEAGGINPSIDTGNTLVALNSQPSGNFTEDITIAPPPAAPPAPAPAPASTSSASPAQAATPATTATATTTTATTTPATTSAPSPTPTPSLAHIIASPMFGPAVPAASAAPAQPAATTPSAVFSNTLYSIWGDGLTVSSSGSTVACQTASAGTLTLSIQSTAPSAAGHATVALALRSSLGPGSAKFSFSTVAGTISATRPGSGTVTKRIRAAGDWVYLRLVGTAGTIQGEYSLDGTNFQPFITIKLNPSSDAD